MLSTNAISTAGSTSVGQDEVKANYSGVPSQALDAVRMRLAQLTHSLKVIRDELMKADLPQWYSLQSQFNVTLSQLLSVTSTLEHFHETLDSTVIYPLPKFPTTSHENLLTTLLRKKYTPEVEEWLKNAKELSDINVNTLSNDEIQKILKNDKDVTKWALEIFHKEFEDRNFKNAQEGYDSVLIAEREKNKNHHKPKKPFELNDVIGYTYHGTLSNIS